MAGSLTRRRFPAASVLVASVFYLFVMGASAFLHHDFACHQNSRTHCPACQVGQDAQRSDIAGTPVDAVHDVADYVDQQPIASVDTPAQSSTSNRAPPAVA